MPLTVEQENRLQRITEKLNEKLKQGENRKQPALCYALDPCYLSTEDYQLLRDADFSIIGHGQPYSLSQPSYFVAILLVFIRNFYEMGRGDNYWKCTPSLSKSNLWKPFIDIISLDSICQELGFSNKLLPQTGSDIDKWVRSQCWIIKANDRGSTSALITNNEKLLNSYIAQFGKLTSWNSPPAHLVKWRLTSDLETIPYVQELHADHRWELLQSLFAVSSEGEIPAELPRWLHPLWGLKRGVMRVEKREKSTDTTDAIGQVKDTKIDAEWMLRFHENEITPVLRLLGGSECVLLQGELMYRPMQDIVLVSDMIKRGFNLEEGLKIKSGESLLELSPLLQSVDETCTMFSVPKVGDRKVRYCGVMAGNSYRWRSRVCILHRRDSLELLCADTICDCLKKETIYNRNGEPYIYITCYKLPDVEEETFVILPGIGPEIHMSNRAQVYIENDSGNKAYKDGEECIVVSSSERMADLSFSGAEMTYIECEGTHCDRKTPRSCCIAADEFYTPYKLSFETNSGRGLTKTVLFVPDNFFESSVYLDLSEPGKWRFRKEDCLFEGILSKSEWGWNDDTEQKCIAVGDCSDPVLTIFRPYTFIELRIGDRCIRKDAAMCAGKHLSEILAMFEDLQPKANCKLFINGKLAYSGPFNPAGSYIYRSGQEVRFYNEKKTGIIYIRHELYYKHYTDEVTRSKYQKVFDAKKEFRRAPSSQNSVVIPPGLYSNVWEPGHVILEQGAERGVCFELPYTGKESIRDRWREIDPKMCSLVALMMSYDNDAIKATRLYSEIDALPAIIVKHLSFVELAKMTRACIIPSLWERASRKDEDMIALGYTRPAYCELSNCPHYKPERYGSTCSYENPDEMSCWRRVHRVANPYYDEEERRAGIKSILAVCKIWVENITIDDRDAKDLCNTALRQMKKTGVLNEKEEMYLYEIIQNAMSGNEWKITFYLLSGILIGISENLDAKLGKTAEKLALRIPADRIDVLSKFVMLVRWISKRYTKQK